MRRLRKLAEKLYNKGHYKLADEVIDLFKGTPKDDHNKRVLEDWRKQKKDQAILEQHENDKTLLQNPEQSSELVYDQLSDGTDLEAPPSRRYDVDLIYADVAEDGSPILKEDSIRDSITVTTEELPKLKEEEKKGFIEILDVQPTYPDAD